MNGIRSVFATLAVFFVLNFVFLLALEQITRPREAHGAGAADAQCVLGGCNQLVG